MNFITVFCFGFRIQLRLQIEKRPPSVVVFYDPSPTTEIMISALYMVFHIFPIILLLRIWS